MKEERKAKCNLIKMALLIVTTVFIFSSPVQAAKLNKTSLTLVKGKTYTLKLKGTKKEATWKTKNKKIAKISGKKKSSVKVKAVKAGKTTITAKVGKKTYKCKVTVINPDKGISDTTVPEEDTDKTAETEETTEQTPAKKKVWIITKWSKTEYTPVFVNKRSQFECTACGYKSEDSEEFDKHEYAHLLKAEPNGYRINTIWDSCYYVTKEYPEEGYWVEINATEYPEGLCWRSDNTAQEKTIKDITTGQEYRMQAGYLYIDKSGN